eukprot:1464605-Rhodomonas_salina.1
MRHENEHRARNCSKNNKKRSEKLQHESAPELHQAHKRTSKKQQQEAGLDLVLAVEDGAADDELANAVQ